MHGKRSIYRRNRTTLIFTLLFSFSFVSLPAQENDAAANSLTASIGSLDSMESWLLYERGLHLFSRKEYGEALNHFNKLIERHGVYPEAEYWIGRVFEQEGEHILAEKQYQKALEAVRVLHIPEQKYEIQYRLAELYKNRGDLDSYSQILNSIILDELENNQLALANESPAINTLKRDGIDRTLLLFRHTFTYSIEAFNQLGIYYYKKGDYRAATAKLIYPLLSFFSITIDYLRDSDPQLTFPEDFDELVEKHSEYVFGTLERIIRRKEKDFSFMRDLDSLEVIDRDNQLRNAATLLPKPPEYYLSGVSCCLQTSFSDPSLKLLMDDYEIFRTMYYLAASLYAEGYTETALRIWEIINMNEDAGMWKLRSEQQLDEPSVDSTDIIF
ncbi:tetratricopeptide repeat protein [Spirochaeta isovalerica]|uniref:Tetratricopeptide (TPR) repeat protein n=1 Tax=Spirochaeta isovalerica TaxID=150 RepID=A0A841R406_9SPIO|nr:tetratricopeptide repeat protein [Spirochaeta isovalerica]MBB6478533.1 tetratricopeptide (TPR) repeat protein [Spirochaeta isovalerica]